MVETIRRCDVLVIGAGIAGASVAAELSRAASVVVLEMESQPGYHTTGRSAALFSGGLGAPLVGALSHASSAFFHAPPSGFSAHPLVSPRGVLMLAREDQIAALEAFAVRVRPDLPLERLDGAAARRLHPLLREGYAQEAIWNPTACDIDVHALHSGYLAMLRANGGEVRVNAQARGVTRAGGRWRVTTAAGVFEAGILVNAAGAWADEFAGLAGLAPLGLRPMRRTALLVDPPSGFDPGALPMAIDIDEQFYMKPDAGKLLLSPADETPLPPQDVQPDEFDIALCADRIMTAFEVEVRRIGHKWAGLRTFTPDRMPVAGFDETAEGFFWLAGQGGFGIQTAPAMARIAAALILGQPAPPDIVDAGATPQALSPRRLHTG